MKLLVLLLVVSTATLVVCEDWKIVKVPLDLLRPDLEALEKYVSRNPGLAVVAYVGWPQGITFEIRSRAGFLEVSGRFHDKDRLIEDVFYFKHGMFFLVPEDEFIEEELSSSLQLYVKRQRQDYVRMQFRSDSTRRYLYISYHSLDEIKEMIIPFYETSRDYSLYELPSTFLARTKDPYPYLVEYTTWTEHPYLMKADGNLRVLIAEGDEGSKIKTLRSVEAPYLVFNKDSNSLQTLADSENPDNRYVRVEKVFAVRMANTGFLADMQTNGGIKMLSNNDLECSPIPILHEIPVAELLQKVQSVEPKFSYEDLVVHPKGRPDNVQFQVRGHLLVKNMNFRDDNNLDKDCPVAVEFAEMHGGHFEYNNKLFWRICTDGSKLWMRCPPNSREYIKTDKIIILHHSLE